MPEGAAANNPRNVAVKLYPDADGRVGRIEVNDRAGAQLGFLTQGASGFTIRAGAGGARFAAVPLAIPQAMIARDQGFVRQLHASQNLGRQVVFQQREFRRANPGFVNPNRPIRAIPARPAAAKRSARADTAWSTAGPTARSTPRSAAPERPPRSTRSAATAFGAEPPGQNQGQPQPGQINRAGQPPVPGQANRPGQQQPVTPPRTGQPQRPGLPAQPGLPPRAGQPSRTDLPLQPGLPPRVAQPPQPSPAQPNAPLARPASPNRYGTPGLHARPAVQRAPPCNAPAPPRRAAPAPRGKPQSERRY